MACLEHSQAFLVYIGTVLGVEQTSVSYERTFLGHVVFASPSSQSDFENSDSMPPSSSRYNHVLINSRKAHVPIKGCKRVAAPHRTKRARLDPTPLVASPFRSATSSPSPRRQHSPVPRSRPQPDVRPDAHAAPPPCRLREPHGIGIVVLLRVRAEEGQVEHGRVPG